MNAKQLEALRTVLEYLNLEKSRFDNLNDTTEDPGVDNLHVWTSLDTLHQYIESIEAPKMSLSLDEVIVTPGAQRCLNMIGQSAEEFLENFFKEGATSGFKDKEANVQNSLELFSLYGTDAGANFWLITKHHRSVTTILHPSEY
jgi:hypothetical protein